MAGLRKVAALLSGGVAVGVAMALHREQQIAANAQRLEDLRREWAAHESVLAAMGGELCVGDVRLLWALADAEETAA